MSSYRYSSDAHADIEGIALYIFDLNPVAARHFLDARIDVARVIYGGRDLPGAFQR